MQENVDLPEEVKQQASVDGLSTTGSELGDAPRLSTGSDMVTNPSSVNDRQLLTFEEDLWDQLDRVQAYQRNGSSMVLGLQNFAISYNKIVKKFSEGLSKCTSNFEKDMFNVMRSMDYMGKRGDASDLEFSTLSIAITGIRSGMDVMARLMEDAAQDIVGDMIEPLETYHKHYSEDSLDCLTKSQQIWGHYKD